MAFDLLHMYERSTIDLPWWRRRRLLELLELDGGKRSRAWLKVKTADWRDLHAPLRHER